MIVILENLLAKNHADYGIYSEKQIEVNDEENIITYLDDIPNLRYLADYYRRYFEYYKNRTNGNWNN